MWLKNVLNLFLLIPNFLEIKTSQEFKKIFSDILNQILILAPTKCINFQLHNWRLKKIDVAFITNISVENPSTIEPNIPKSWTDTTKELSLRKGLQLKEKMQGIPI